MENTEEKNKLFNCGKLIAIAAIAVVFSGTAYAGTVTNPLLSGTATVTNGSTTTWNLSSSAPYTDNGDGTFTYVGSDNPASPIWSLSWDITVNPDPFISSTLTIINKTSATKHFDILFTLPVAPFVPGVKSASMSASFADFSGNSSPADGTAALTNVDWSGRIDGSDAMFLYAFDSSCGPGSPGCTGGIGTLTNGPLVHHAGVSLNIGVHLAFDLTAGDKATFTNYFEVMPVPLPAAFWLFSLGLGVLSVFAKKKK